MTTNFPATNPYDPSNSCVSSVITHSTEQQQEHQQTAYETHHQSAHLRTNSSLQFSCLYSRHKTQKRKVWLDGRLVVRGCRASIHAANVVPGSSDPVLDQCELSRPQFDVLKAGQVQDLESEKYLITVDGPWTAAAEQTPNATTAQPGSSSAILSASMQKIVSRKFQRPKHRVPPPLRSQGSFLPKRRRPLQPGELQRKYYGQQQQQQGPAPPGYGQQPQGYPAPPSHLPPSVQSHAIRNSSVTANGFSENPPQQQQCPPFQSSQSNTVSPPQLPVASSTVSNPFLQENTNTSHEQIRGVENSNISHGAIDSRVTSSTSHPLPKSSLWDAGNGFDPSSFYGEDEEEEEEETTPDPFAVHTTTTSATTPPSQEETAPTPFAVTATVTTEEESNQDRHSTLSTNQLLDLFGAAPGAVHDSDETVMATTGAPTPTAHIPSSANKDTVASKSVSENLDAATAVTTAPTPSDDFELPPTADSSDEESSPEV